MSDFQIAVNLVLNHEGGYVNNPSDPGGETNFGIAKRWHPDLDIRNLTKDQASVIYQQQYCVCCVMPRLIGPKIIIRGFRERSTFDMARNKEKYNAWQRAWRAKNKEKLQVYNKSYYEKWNEENADKIKQYRLSFRKRRRYAVLQLLGGKCIKCGFEDFRALQIDHIHGGGRKEERELGSNAAIHRKILNMEHPETEYQCLCANCNWIKREEDKECEK